MNEYKCPACGKLQYSSSSIKENEPCVYCGNEKTELQKENKETRFIYISHPFGGKQENKDKVEAVIRQLIKDDPENIYISPIHAFGYLYNDIPYDRGLELCGELLIRCDAAIFCDGWEESKGCRYELVTCKLNGIPYEELIN